MSRNCYTIPPPSFFLLTLFCLHLLSSLRVKWAVTGVTTTQDDQETSGTVDRPRLADQFWSEMRYSCVRKANDNLGSNNWEHKYSPTKTLV